MAPVSGVRGLDLPLALFEKRAMTALVENDLEAIDRDGFVVLPELLSSDEIEELRTGLAPHLATGPGGRNNFEGHRTQRVYSLVGLGPAFERLALHPRILAICDRLLETNYLLTASQAIHILPGETSQPLHSDDVFYRIPRPRPAVSISTIWALDPFTEENGATEVIAGSHRWEDSAVGELLREVDFGTSPDGRPLEPTLSPAVRAQLRQATMPAGSVIVFLGLLLHRGGANRSAVSRLALSNQYCEPWARQQENFLLSVPRSTARRMPERLQQMLGYSVHPPFMGHVRGLHPRRLLETD